MDVTWEALLIAALLGVGTARLIAWLVRSFAAVPPGDWPHGPFGRGR